MSHEDIAAADIEQARVRRISSVWIVPVLAAVIGAIVAWQSFADQGPLVEITFSKGHGIEAGKTEIKHNDVVVGLVEDVTFTEGLDGVLVKARMDKVVAPYLGETTDFWIVGATISGTDLSGLGTLLSGSYIEVDWAEQASGRKTRFEGLDVRPLTPPGAKGRHFNLRSETAGSITVGSPVFYRKIRVGQVEGRHLAEDFSHVIYDAFIEAPYDSLLSPATNFWNVSGVRVDAGANGLSVQLESLEALLVGGIAFGNVGLSVGTVSLPDDVIFPIYPSREAAEESQFDAIAGEGFLFMALFDDSVEGLERGAPIEWQGIRVGSVRDVVLEMGETPTDRQRVYVVLEIQPGRIGLQDVPPENVRLAMESWVATGMRVQLATGNILSGKKLVKFVDGIGKDDAMIDFEAVPYPAMPTAPSELGALAQNVEQIIANVSELPLDDLARSVIDLLENTDALIANPDTKRLLKSFAGTAENLEAASVDFPKLIASLNQIADAGESTLSGLSPNSELYADLSGALRNLRDASRSLAALAAVLEQNPNAIITGR
ncbi:MAG: intermembrane transport protein PqiB [Alphaproteobacteria bacterium]